MRSLVTALVAVIAACHHGRPPPPPPSCASTAAHVQGLLAPRDPRAIEVRDAILAHCVRDRWPDEVRGCILRTTSLADPQHCKAKLDVDQRARLDAALLEIDERAKHRKVATACEVWKALITKLDGCDALPRVSRDALIQSFEIQRRSLDELDPADAEAQCRSGIEIINQVASGMCGW